METIPYSLELGQLVIWKSFHNFTNQPGLLEIDYPV